MNNVSYFKKVSVKESVNNWTESIIVAATPLLEAGCITDNYVNAMIDNVKNNGSYIVIMPHVALPHSRAEMGVMKTGVSILKLDQPVMYPDDKSVKLIIAFSANDNNQHMELLSVLAEVLMDESRLKEILNANDTNEIENLFFN
ncbi:MAG: PTS sugar transporter subunit IIA [Erysipelotrichia bacterium]|jgi:mannitol/fructose-specific phosphotransferase system IIA component (Ntr-type)|nr:PTS sugar transporter subunit IIA [Erysipelotrichia bacterium]